MFVNVFCEVSPFSDWVMRARGGSGHRFQCSRTVVRITGVAFSVCSPARHWVITNLYTGIQVHTYSRTHVHTHTHTHTHTEHRHSQMGHTHAHTHSHTRTHDRCRSLPFSDATHTTHTLTRTHDCCPQRPDTHTHTHTHVLCLQVCRPVSLALPLLSLLLSVCLSAHCLSTQAGSNSDQVGTPDILVPYKARNLDK